MAPKNAVINDVNEQLLNLYRQLNKDAISVADIIDSLDDGECDKQLYMDRREQYNNKVSAGVLDAECAALFVWMNKHCFNGLYRVNSKGLFNVPWNKKTTGSSYVRENLINVGAYLSGDNDTKVIIRQGDFTDAVADVNPEDFVYFDSPYVPVSETASFTSYAKDGFSEEDHRRLAALCKELDKQNVKWMLSNNDVPFVHELYDGFLIEPVSVRRSINRDHTKRRGAEVVIRNYGSVLPGNDENII